MLTKQEVTFVMLLSEIIQTSATRTNVKKRFWYMTVRIDFHLHTRSAEEKDDGFEFSLSWLKRYTQRLNIGAIAITNHNLFDLKQFNQIEDALSCAVLPGVELSLEGGHVNLVFENTSENKTKLVEACQGLDLGSTAGLSVSKFKNLFSDLNEGLFIYEYGKSNSLVVNDEFQDPFFKHYTFVRGVNSQLRFQRALLQVNADCPALFSDGHATEYDPDPVRNDITKLALKNTFLQIEKFSFEQVLLEFQSPRHVKVTADGQPNIFQIDVEGNPVTVSTKLNLIVGRRGSGKTFLLNHINRQYDNGDASVAYIRQFRSAQDTEDFLKSESSRIASEARNQWVKKHQSMLDGIVSFYKELSSDNVDSYLSSLKRFASELVNTSVAKRVKLFSESEFEIPEIRSIGVSLTKLKDVIDNQALWQFATEGKREKYWHNVVDAYNDLQKNFIKKAISNAIKKEVNGTMKVIKTTVTNRTAIEPVANIDLFHQFERQKEQAKIVHSVGAIINEVQSLSEVEYSYTIHVWKESWQSAEDFLKATPHQGGKMAVKENLIKPYLNGDYQKFLTNLFSTQYQSYFTLDSGLDFSRYLTDFKVELLTQAGTPASGGQQMALGLMMKLDDAKQNDIVLVDEPEGSLDNVFIKDELIPKLRELAESTPVFVITHNSTLGALLNPDRLLIAKFDSNSKEYQLRSGDFLAKKVSNSSGEESQSYDDFVDAMEAGIDTYKEKGRQYANLKIR